MQRILNKANPPNVLNQRILLTQVHIQLCLDVHSNLFPSSQLVTAVRNRPNLARRVARSYFEMSDFLSIFDLRIFFDVDLSCFCRFSSAVSTPFHPQISIWSTLAGRVAARLHSSAGSLPRLERNRGTPWSTYTVPAFYWFQLQTQTILSLRNLWQR